MARLGTWGRVVGLTTLVAVDVFLVTLAVRHAQADSAVLAELDASRPPPPRITPAETPTPTPSPTVSATPRSWPPGARTLIDLGTGDAVARASLGVCGMGGGAARLSIDGGESFEPGTLPRDVVVVHVSSIDADNASVVVMDDECRDTQRYTTSNGGGRWEPDDTAPRVWHLLPEPGSRVQSPRGQVDVACPANDAVLGLDALSVDQAYALCGDGTIVHTTNGGIEWSERGWAEGALDVTFTDERTGLVAATELRSCDGVAVLRSTDGGETWEPQGCVRTTVDAMPAIAAEGDRAYLTVGAKLWYSDDAGASWEERGDPNR